jgi:hypothetical protein
VPVPDRGKLLAKLEDGTFELRFFALFSSMFPAACF